MRLLRCKKDGATDFLCYRKLRKPNLAVLHCLDTSKAWTGKQSPAGVARFFIIGNYANLIFLFWLAEI
jgi:hypothetical protein